MSSARAHAVTFEDGTTAGNEVSKQKKEKNSKVSGEMGVLFYVFLILYLFGKVGGRDMSALKYRCLSK